MKDKKVTRNSEHGFARRKSCLTTLIAFYNEMTGFVDEGRAEDTVFLHCLL